MVDTVVAAGATRTDRLSMSGTDTLIVEGATFNPNPPPPVLAPGVFSVGGQNQTVRFNGPTTAGEIDNDGTIENTAAEGRAIRFESSVGANLTASIDNAGLIRSNDDAIQIQVGTVSAGQVTIGNATTITSVNGQAIDFENTSGTFVADISNSGTISSNVNDAIRIGSVGQIINFGTINGGTDAAYGNFVANPTNPGNADGIQFEDNATGDVQNYDDQGGLISGDRHGIDAGVGSNITVTNGVDLGPGNISGATINGRNGSGVGSDGTATIINYGAIRGNFANIAGTDANGSTVGQPDGGGPDGTLDGDGDGVDVDFELTLTNFGVIEGTGAGGTGSDGLSNTSEGVAAGGGTINNAGTISGAGLGILIDDSSQGNAQFLTEIFNTADGTISGGTSFAIRIISDLDDGIYNAGTITGGAGAAIQFGSGDNTLRIGDGSVINGSSDGGAGIDTLDYSLRTGAVIADVGAGLSDGTGGVVNFENIVGSTFADSLTGGGLANVLDGGSGADSLDGDAGNDTLIGAVGNDRLFGGAGNDLLSGGVGNDIVRGGTGNDVYSTNLAIGGADSVSLDGGADKVVLSATGSTQIRLTFTSAEVGNGSTSDSNTLANQDGRLAVHVQAEDGGGALTGAESRYDDEGVTFLATSGVTYDVRDLVSGIQRGDSFGAVFLGTGGADSVVAPADGRNTYINAGMGDDTVTGDDGADFLVGGAGGDRLNGGLGNDSLLGGAGADTLAFSTTLGAGNIDTVIGFVAGTDTFALDSGDFAGLAAGALAAGAFNTGAAATEADDRIIYDAGTGRLFFDADGSGAGAQLQFATTAELNLALTAADFTVI